MIILSAYQSVCPALRIAFESSGQLMQGNGDFKDYSSAMSGGFGFLFLWVYFYFFKIGS